MDEPRVALVHDWLTGMRGGEKVLLELCRLFPKSEIHTLLWNRGSVHQEIEQRVVQTSFLQRMPGAATGYRHYLPLFPTAVRSLRIEDADLVLSSSHAVAKGVRVPKAVPHVSYIHTPMRYLWGDSRDYFSFGKGRLWNRVALAVVSPYLRWFDLRSGPSIDQMIANSEHVRDRVRRVYGRDARVIYPPVDTEFFCLDPALPIEDFYLVVSPLEPYKRADLAIDAFRLLQRRLVVVGTGTLEAELRAAASGNVQFTGRVSDGDLLGWYRRCRALVFPGIEDFGMVPVEAQACGRPVICCGRGGATESVMDGETGVHFRPQTVQALAAAVEQFEERSWDPEKIRRNSLRFSSSVFRARMAEAVREACSEPVAAPGAGECA